MTDFEAFPKIPRLMRDMVITEKIDGTNAAVVFDDEGQLLVQSRKRLITPMDDNYGFARWAFENQTDLFRVLGPGRHFGEWWGQGIQRRYGLDEKRFSLFNTSRWGWLNDEQARESEKVPPQLYAVPVIQEGRFSTSVAQFALAKLNISGSHAAPGFDRPEGIVVYHVAANALFKYTIEHDEAGKGE